MKEKLINRALMCLTSALVSACHHPPPDNDRAGYTDLNRTVAQQPNPDRDVSSASEVAANKDSLGKLQGGAGTGAGTGAALGAIFVGGKGAAIGAGVGATVGGITGYNWQNIHNRLSGAAKGTGTQITEQPDGSLKLNVPSSLTFDASSDAIKPPFASVLDQLVPMLQQNPEVIVQVVGHTDSAGSPAYNQTLSINRAESVTDYLTQRGIAPQRLSAQGAGQNQPIADNSTEAGRAANRRVEIYLRATAQHAN
jgi:outer membrane protein OmpA-like peptidoglycan-associated protein